MPFRICNPPGTFQHLVNMLFKKGINKFMVVYLDNIMVFSCMKKEHEQHLKWVMEILRENQLYVSAKKCEFFTHETEYLGHIVGRGQVRMDPAKITAIIDWP